MYELIVDIIVSVNVVLILILIVVLANIVSQTPRFVKNIRTPKILAQLDKNQDPIYDMIVMM
jgi:hypothetical protein